MYSPLKPRRVRSLVRLPFLNRTQKSSYCGTAGAEKVDDRAVQPTGWNCDAFCLVGICLLFIGRQHSFHVAAFMDRLAVFVRDCAGH